METTLQLPASPPLPAPTGSALCKCQERLKNAPELAGMEPSAGHDWIDEVLGLLRVARMQRDDAERRNMRSEMADRFFTQNTEVSDGGPLTPESKPNANPPFAGPTSL